MELKKVKKENFSGFQIILIIAGTQYYSYWSAPPESVDHVGLEYLRDRYPIINTKERANTFKELYKNLWIDVSERQLEEMKHCIGLNYRKRPYRNYFYTEEYDKYWNDLVFKGLAIKGKRMISEKYANFFLTKQGFEYVLGKSISTKCYEKI